LLRERWLQAVCALLAGDAVLIAPVSAQIAC
jgi:hypothetical protein